MSPKVPNEVGEIAKSAGRFPDLRNGDSRIEISFLHLIGLKLASPVNHNDLKLCRASALMQ